MERFRSATHAHAFALRESKLRAKSHRRRTRTCEATYKHCSRTAPEKTQVKTGTGEFPRYDWSPRAKITDRVCLRAETPSNERRRIRTLGEEDGMSTLAVVEAILREAAMPLSVREIVERAGDALPTRSKTPDTVVARDLSMDIKRRSEASTFVRTSPGRYAIRELAQAQGRRCRGAVRFGNGECACCERACDHHGDRAGEPDRADRAADPVRVERPRRSSVRACRTTATARARLRPRGRASRATAKTLRCPPEPGSARPAVEEIEGGRCRTGACARAQLASTCVRIRSNVVW